MNTGSKIDEFISTTTCGFALIVGIALWLGWVRVTFPSGEGAGMNVRLIDPVFLHSLGIFVGMRIWKSVESIYHVAVCRE